MQIESEKYIKEKVEKLNHSKISLIKAYEDLIELLENTNDINKANFYKKQLEKFERKVLIEEFEKSHEEIHWKRMNELDAEEK